MSILVAGINVRWRSFWSNGVPSLNILNVYIIKYDHFSGEYSSKASSINSTHLHQVGKNRVDVGLHVVGVLDRGFSSDSLKSDCLFKCFKEINRCFVANQEGYKEFI